MLLIKIIIGETMKSKIVNFISGPSVGKSVFTASTFIEMKVRGHSAEIVPEFAKKLVWEKEFELLNNQYFVSHQQYKSIKSVNGAMPFIITDGSLLHGLVYNKINKENTSNIEKTEKAILNWFNEFDNLVIFLERNNSFPYEMAGRLQSEKEARDIDALLEKELLLHGIPFVKIQSDLNNTEMICDLIEKSYFS